MAKKSLDPRMPSDDIRAQINLNLYSIRDSKGESFNLPFASQTHGEAERNFLGAMQDDRNLLGKYPDDFDLYHVGTYNQFTGKITGLDTPYHVIKGSNLRAAKSNQITQ